MLNTPLGRFRLVAIAEGISYVLLLGVAMPLKYIWDMPLMTKWVGWAHGVLFIAYCGLGLHAALVQKWSFVKSAIAFLASLVPFGTFVLDAKLRHEEDLALDTHDSEASSAAS
jgi:integral membrane protein